ncbi:Mitochondrial carrier protein ymc2 [Terramyces sp. JEL0728]|nr:Mitochondrial carrier protein ymc2 [Terramyces sp. JEL0728]
MGEEKKHSSTQTIKELFAGSIGGVAQVLTGQPFDTVKVRLQTQSRENPLYTGVADCVKKTVKNEGFLGLYKGTLTPLLGAGVCVAIQFSALESAKRFLGKDLSLGQLYLAGAFSGICNSVVSGPMEHVRTRLQVQTGGGFSGPWDFIKKTSQQYGWSSIYKGQMITLLREFHGYGIYFMVYEYLIKKTMEKEGITRSQVSPIKQLTYGALSGYVLWIMIYPIDVVKSKLQTDSFDKNTAKYKSTMDCFRKTFAVEGVAGFYRGFLACMLRAGPANGATFAAYELAMNLVGRD